jgi:uncharacterized protein YndB with AHSA1/START domain
MAESRFLYVTYIRATPQQVWGALVDPAQNRKFWNGYHQESTWAEGADYRIVGPDGHPWDSGHVVVAEPPKKLSVTWLHLRDESMRREGTSTATFELEPVRDGLTRLTLTHAIGIANSKLITAVSGGWPMILASLKSLLETGEALA